MGACPSGSRLGPSSRKLPCRGRQACTTVTRISFTMISKRVFRAGAAFSGHLNSPNSLTAAAGACFDNCQHHCDSRAAQQGCPAACTTLPPSSPRVMSSAGSKSRHGIVRGAFDGAFGGVTTGSVCANPSGIVNITINGRKLRVRKRGYLRRPAGSGSLPEASGLRSYKSTMLFEACCPLVYSSIVNNIRRLRPKRRVLR